MNTFQPSISRPFILFLTRAAADSVSVQPESDVEKVMKSGKRELINNSIYDCDLEELSAILIKADVSHSTDALIHTLNICGFVANDRKVEQKFRLIHQVRTVTTSHSSPAIADLVQFNLSRGHLPFVCDCEMPYLTKARSSRTSKEANSMLSAAE
jgi:hypothetical protein